MIFDKQDQQAKTPPQTKFQSQSFYLTQNIPDEFLRVFIPPFPFSSFISFLSLSHLLYIVSDDIFKPTVDTK